MCSSDLLGRMAQPRRRHVPAERFVQRQELPAEAHTTALLQPWCVRLLESQERFLVARDAALLECRWHFHHRAGQGSTHLVLSRAQPTTRADDWESLLAEHLSRLLLQAPVVSVSLRSGPLLPAVPLTDGLAGHAGEDRAAALRLLDRLRARLGGRAVHRGSRDDGGTQRGCS